MTVQELINELLKVENKSKDVFYGEEYEEGPFDVIGIEECEDSVIID